MPQITCTGLMWLAQLQQQLMASYLRQGHTVRIKLLLVEQVFSHSLLFT